MPGDKPALLPKAVASKADSIILDLEDGVAVDKKEQARLLVRQALVEQQFAEKEVVVRINALCAGSPGYQDIDLIARVKPDALLLPKAGEKEMKTLAGLLDSIEDEEGIRRGTVKIFALVESSRGLLDIERIISASDRVAGVLFGAEDFTVDLGIRRTDEGEELLYARSKIAVACRAYGVDAVDALFGNLGDTAGLIKDTEKALSLGMTGKIAIHPRQVGIIHEVMTPSSDEVRYAQRVVAAMEQAQQEGRGVFSLDNKMIDAPVVARAHRILLKANPPDKMRSEK